MTLNKKLRVIFYIILDIIKTSDNYVSCLTLKAKCDNIFLYI